MSRVTTCTKCWLKADGPLKYEPETVHSLRVYLKGDGIISCGYYLCEVVDGELVLTFQAENR